MKNLKLSTKLKTKLDYKQLHSNIIGDNTYRVINESDPDNPVIIDASEIYDIYGYKIQDLTPDIDELDIENTGYEGDIRIIKAEKDGKVATKRVIIQ